LDGTTDGGCDGCDGCDGGCVVEEGEHMMGMVMVKALLVIVSEQDSVVNLGKFLGSKLVTCRSSFGDDAPPW